MGHVLFSRAGELVRARRIDADIDLGSLVDDPPADVDPEVIVRLGQMHRASAWVILESAIADLPVDLRWLFESGAVTVEQLAGLRVALEGTSLHDLTDAIRTGALASVPGFDEATAAEVATALADLRLARPRIPLGRAVATAEPILSHLRASPGIKWALPVGSLRRGQETVGDIEILAASADPDAAIDELCRRPGVSRCLYRSARRVYLLAERVQIGVRFADPANAGATLAHLTGSASHLAALRSRAAKKGFRLTAEGLFTAAGEPHPAPAEEDLYAALGLPYIPPEIRDGEDEIEAAAGGTLRPLVSRPDIRGDLHMHTLWSDGRDSVEAMVVACRALGYEYLAITDHSQRSAAAKNLTVIGVTDQAEEIAQLREKYRDITILHGCEVDILPDARLDFSDKILERFDIVLASLHERAGHSREQLLKRYAAAMKHPLVTVITHPSNRLVPSRSGYDLDYDRLFEVAVGTGTALEIDGAPVHLDMDGALTRRAIAAGATLVIDSDAHRADALERNMELGTMMARRGWAEPRHILNTRPLADVRALIARKRAT